MKRPLRHALRFLPALAAAALLAWVLRSADPARALALVHSLGWRLPLLLLPNLLAMLCDTVGWWAAFPPSTRPRLPALFGVRLASEALMVGLPSGSLVNESMLPYLLRRRCALDMEDGIVGTVARKFLVVLSHGLFLALATVATWPQLRAASPGALGRRGLPALLLGASAVMVALALLLAAMAARGRVADRLHRRLGGVGSRRLGGWLDRNSIRFQRTDAGLSAVFRSRRRRLVLPVVLYLLGWSLRAAETLLFLTWLGVPASFSAAMVIETALILLRALAVPLPAGLGVQDAGYVVALRMLRVADPVTVGAAFVLMKRGKDLLFLLLGLVMLGSRRARLAQPVLQEGSGALSPQA